VCVYGGLVAEWIGSTEHEVRLASDYFTWTEWSSTRTVLCGILVQYSNARYEVRSTKLLSRWLVLTREDPAGY
jgi:hypothetical protein